MVTSKGKRIIDTKRPRKVIARKHILGGGARWYGGHRDQAIHTLDQWDEGGSETGEGWGRSNQSDDRNERETKNTYAASI
jgi:hypothetical protein